MDDKPETLAEAHYRPATTQGKRCDTCRHYGANGDSGYCFMFRTPVRAEYVCDEWTTRSHRTYKFYR